MTKCVKVLRSKSKAKSMDHSQARIKRFQTVPTRIRPCDWSMLFAFAFARNTLTHFVIQLSQAPPLVWRPPLRQHPQGTHAPPPLPYPLPLPLLKAELGARQCQTNVRPM